MNCPKWVEKPSALWEKPNEGTWYQYYFRGWLRMSKENKTVFFAYESGLQNTRDSIRKAAKELKKAKKGYKITTWEDLDNSGNIIWARISEAIKTCDVFACDMTHLNHNVLFELGYAIACKRNLRIFIDTTVSGATEAYESLYILKTIGYEKYSSAKEIKNKFQQHNSGKPLLIDDIIPDIENEKISSDIFLVNSKIKTQAAIDIETLLKLHKDWRCILNDENEIPYQTFQWYLRTIAQSTIIILHMTGKDRIDFTKTNAEYSLYAGIACGLNKNVLLLAPSPYKAPIDYSDILITYETTDDCQDKFEKYLEKTLSYQETGAKKNRQDIDKNTGEQELNLLELGIGMGVAEQEPLSVVENFVEINAYKEALNPNRNYTIFTGRKGSGKTEIFLRLCEQLKTSNDNFFIVIKPDSDEILGTLELSHLYKGEKTMRAFFQAVWKYVICSKIYQEIIKNIQKLNLNVQEKDGILAFYNEHRGMFNVNFYGMTAYVYKQFQGSIITPDMSLLEKVHEMIRPMLQYIVMYFKNRKYRKIIILADNLDAGWKPENDLSAQSIMLNTLFDYIKYLGNDIKNDQKNIRYVVFLRTEIFSYILKYAHERDKLSIEEFEINWENFPDLLNDVICKRIIYVLNGKVNIEDIWGKFFALGGTLKPLERIQEVIIKRPRDAIYFMGKMFESAATQSKQKVDKDDFAYAFDAYAKFLYQNMIKELDAEFPEIENILKAVQSKYPELLNKTTTMPFETFDKTLENFDVDKENLLRSLMAQKYVIGMIKPKEKCLISNFDELIQKKEERVFKIFKKNKISLVFRFVPFSDL
jgi:Cdc6-like AAA superfamily ATPase